jgi:hypothetical protein
MITKQTKFILFLLYFFVVLIFPVAGQSFHSEFWSDVSEASILYSGTRYIIPEQYRTLELKIENISMELSTAPKEKNIKVQDSDFLVDLPMPNGISLTFRVIESPVMAEELAIKYPEIKTYLGQGITQPGSKVRFDLTPQGFHAMIFTSEGTVYIDPYSHGDDRYYISYYKQNFHPTENHKNFLCEFNPDPEILEEMRQLVEANPFVTTGEQLRTYRLANAATGEYTIFHGGTVALGLAAVVTAVNRVTGVYENEVAVRMVLIPNNDLIIYTNPSTDPYTNNNGVTMLSQNQSNLDAVIGSANYDIGHVFSTGGGGVANLACVCVNGSKARGVTGLPSPIGDPFYIDYVAHEMGHQFGGNHSFNGNAGSCSGGNRNGATAYEPGSGSTIMAYAGICGSQNLQNFSDDYFHTISVVEMANFTQNGSGNSCPVITSTGNLPPTVNAGTGGYTIPINTPFLLTGSATDPNSDPLTYCWEEWDLGPAGHPNTPTGNAPIFRTFDPVAVPYRTFPKLADLQNNTQTIGEILPSYSRTLTFRLTARDNRAGGGGINYAQMQFSVTNGAGPFLVTNPNTNVSWVGNSTQNVTWNVANTSIAPVNVSNVNILLSTNGGNTWTVTVLSNTPNDGSESITVPNIATTQARIRVEAAGNVFFDISNVNFTITEDPIPVELTAFFALKFEDGIMLKWTTATETNNAGFGIERSTNNTNFSEIAFVEGNGTTTEIKDYNYFDRISTPGIFYYRLKQVNYDGSFNYSNTVQAEIDGPAAFVLSQNYPNPFNPSTVIAFSLPVDSKVTIDLFTTLGEKIDVIIDSELSIGHHEITYDASSLSNGVYYYKINAIGKDGSDFISTRKMVLMK